LPLIIAQSDKAATWCRRCSDNTDKNVDAAKTRSDLIDYLRASCRRAEVSLNKYKLTLFTKTSGSSSCIACGSYDYGSSVKKSAYYSFANSCSSSRDKDPFSTKLICNKWKFDLYDDSLFTTVLNFASLSDRDISGGIDAIIQEQSPSEENENIQQSEVVENIDNGGGNGNGYHHQDSSEKEVYD
jgi:hypothetical protein